MPPWHFEIHYGNLYDLGVDFSRNTIFRSAREYGILGFPHRR